MTLLTADIEPLWIARYDYEAGWRLPLHAHEDYFQIIYIQSGTGEALIGSSRRPFAPGQLLFLRPQLRHGLTAGTATVRTLDTKFRIHLPALRRACGRLESFQTQTDPSVVSALEAIIAEARLHGSLTNELCQALLAQILILLVRREPVAGTLPTRARVEPPSGEVDLCRRMEIFLHENCAQKIDQSTLSKALRYSYRHLHAVWKKRHRESPLQALWAYRVDRATHFIRYSDYELKRIAEMTGFASVHHFTRVFTRLAGVSPARWRDRERDGVRQDIVLRPGFINPVLTLPAEPSASQSTSAREPKKRR